MRVRTTLSTSLLILVCVVQLGTFVAAQLEFASKYPISSVRPHEIGVGDLNADGFADLVVGSYDTTISVLLNKGDGTFQPPVDYTVGGSPCCLTVGDFNNDGKLDVAVSSSTGLDVLLGNGDGSLGQPLHIIDTANAPVRSGDFNNDGNLDLVTAVCVINPCVSVLLGNGDGTFQSPITNTTLTVGTAASTVADFNHDGKLDVAIAGSSGHADVNILFGNGDGSLKPAVSYPITGSPSWIAAGDLNLDGSLDLVIADVEAGMSVLLGNADGTFQADKPFPANSTYGVSVADFNADGKPDLALAKFTVTNNLALLLGNGDGTFQPGPKIHVDPSGAFTDAVGDFNGDQIPDLVVTDFRLNAVSIFMGTGVVKFTPPTPPRFPSVVLGQTSNGEKVTVTNTGPNPLLISSISIDSPHFAFQSQCGTDVPPGARCDIGLTFTPSHLDLHSGTLSIVDSASSKPQKISLRASGTIVSLYPHTLDFGSQPIGTKSDPRGVTLTNAGNRTLNISSIALTGNNTHSYIETHDCGSQLAAGASCKITVVFFPQFHGPLTASVDIQHDGGASPQSVHLRGIGTSPLAAPGSRPVKLGR